MNSRFSSPGSVPWIANSLIGLPDELFDSITTVKFLWKLFRLESIIEKLLYSKNARLIDMANIESLGFIKKIFINIKFNHSNYYKF